MSRRRSWRSRLWSGTKDAGAEGCVGCGCELSSCVTVLVAGAATVAVGRGSVAVARRHR